MDYDQFREFSELEPLKLRKLVLTIRPPGLASRSHRP